MNKEKKRFLAKELYSFMEENKCLDKFKNAFNRETNKKWRKEKLYKNYDDIMNYINAFVSNKIIFKTNNNKLIFLNIKSFFSYSFLWWDTDEGPTYWSIISSKWMIKSQEY
jgi:hypothetical protein